MSAVLDPRGGALPLSTSPAPRPAADAPLRLAGAGPRARTRDRTREGGRGAGLAAVVGVHALIGWALASGLAQHVAEAVRRPIEASLLVDAPPPPPPPPPPRVEKIRDQPRTAVPPPAYVPPPVVAPPPAPAEPVITATQSTPPPAPVAAPPAPAAEPAPAPPAVVRREISLACPGYEAVLAQGLQDAFDRVGVPGTVRTRLVVRGSEVVDAVPLSGPKAYYKFVQAAARRLKCSAGGADEVQVNLDVHFAP
jgi:protein TonB